MWPHGVAVSTLDFESSDPSSSLGGASCYVTMWTSSTSLMRVSGLLDFVLLTVCFHKKIRSMGLALPIRIYELFLIDMYEKGKKATFCRSNFESVKPAHESRSSSRPGSFESYTYICAVQPHPILTHAYILVILGLSLISFGFSGYYAPVILV